MLILIKYIMSDIILSGIIYLVGDKILTKMSLLYNNIPGRIKYTISNKMLIKVIYI